MGTFTALHYQRAHPAHHVLLLDRGTWPDGATVRNAGFACFGSPSELLADIESEGRDAALSRVERRWKGLLALRRELGDEALGYEACGGHELYREGDGLYTRVADAFDDLNRDLHAIVGSAPYRWNDGSISGLGFGAVAHMATNVLEGALDSGRLMRSLLAKATAAGVLYQGKAHVKGIQPTASGVEVALADGTMLRARRVVVATNGYARELLPALDVEPARGQVLLTAPVPGGPPVGTFHLEEGFYYFRHLGDSVLLGGGRHLDLKGERTTADGLTPVVQDALMDLLRHTILPGRNVPVLHRWSGIMGMGSSKSPIVQEVMPGVVAAVRLGGMGVAIGIQVAEEAVALVGR